MYFFYYVIFFSKKSIVEISDLEREKKVERAHGRLIFATSFISFRTRPFYMPDIKCQATTEHFRYNIVRRLIYGSHFAFAIEEMT